MKSKMIETNEKEVKSTDKAPRMTENSSELGPDLKLHGLPIRQSLAKWFRKRGIKCATRVETHRRSNDELVVRGIESGGALAEAGHYVTFCDDLGARLPGYFFYDGGLGFNGRHAIVVVPLLIKIEMVREGRMYQLMITRHVPDASQVGAPMPGSIAERIFFGAEGFLDLDLVRKDKRQQGLVVPTFFTPAGEILTIPGEWLAAVRAAAAGTNCRDCKHSHYLNLPRTPS